MRRLIAAGGCPGVGGGQSMSGRKPGVLVAGSVQAQIAAMKVGNVVWVETTAGRYGHVQREWNLARSRRTSETRDYVIECSVWRAVPASVKDDVTVLVRVERKE